ncbi:ABC transporter substrate-binding protein [Leucobacter sp. OH2974_COT-288]|uniref:Polar amino acid transport system substrate-binding protein n=1 Tax=Canibacter oris TaxID=1365628 RepID=A0A840DIS4_9MICO|nr:ABC transporter substrate-binding protein [Canibacter oris]MBB4071382.1 polar amino acid transport system substrate-binding protein [Canibacter oris]RRD35254.1 ABC transporter substrate-binding protein [Leucobacter sp. OH2974_COT-288]
MKKKNLFTFPAMAAVAALALTGCVNDDGAAGGSGVEVSGVDEAAVALLPAEVKEAGKLVVGTDAEYPPNEFKDASGQPAGWSVDLVEAIGAKLGLEVEWEIMSFDSILPRVEEGALSLGSSSFTDTLERQKTVDFVNYLQAGTAWAAPKGSTVDPDNACGMKVSVQSGTIQHTDDLPARSKACEDAGKAAIDILQFETQAEATQALLDGRADAMAADSPITGDAIAKSEGELVAIGKLYDAAPYGFPFQKGSGVGKAVQAALQSLMDDGSYEKLLKSAGLESGALKEATINAGNS